LLPGLGGLVADVRRTLELTQFSILADVSGAVTKYRVLFQIRFDDRERLEHWLEDFHVRDAVFERGSLRWDCSFPVRL